MSTSGTNGRRRFLRQACPGRGRHDSRPGPERAGGPATVTLPFANGERELIAYPQKRP